MPGSPGFQLGSLALGPVPDPGICWTRVLGCLGLTSALPAPWSEQACPLPICRPVATLALLGG